MFGAALMPGGTAQMPRGRFSARVGQGRFRPTGLWWQTPGYGGGYRFQSPKFYGSFSITGVTRDSAGAALGTCIVHLFETPTDIEVAQTTSDGSGNFTFTIGNNAGYFYIVAYKAGAPDVAGTSINTLIAV
jgi:hypothetical protein